MSQTQSLLECVLCDGPLKAHWHLKKPEKPRWVTIDQGEHTWQEHRILCGVCLYDYWQESRKSWKKFEMSSSDLRSAIFIIICIIVVKLNNN